MGLLRTTIEVENLDRRGPARSLPDTLVDTGSEYTWIPRDVLEGLRIIVERKQGFVVADGRRSEEHTSELQSQSNLVCRLLLEKKKKKRKKHHVNKRHKQLNKKQRALYSTKFHITMKLY